MPLHMFGAIFIREKINGKVRLFCRIRCDVVVENR